MLKIKNVSPNSNPKLTRNLLLLLIKLQIPLHFWLG